MNTEVVCTKPDDPKLQSFFYHKTKRNCLVSWNRLFYVSFSSDIKQTRKVNCGKFNFEWDKRKLEQRLYSALLISCEFSWVQFNTVRVLLASILTLNINFHYRYYPFLTENSLNWCFRYSLKLNRAHLSTLILNFRASKYWFWSLHFRFAIFAAGKIQFRPLIWALMDWMRALGAGYFCIFKIFSLRCIMPD